MMVPPNELEAFFDARTEGRGIWKWRHYFDIYHRHFDPLRRRPGLAVLEVGVYSGGSLDLWRAYFGPDALLIGVDIQPECMAYEAERTRIVLGDQADPRFWKQAIEVGSVPALDIAVDDGGHKPEQQRVTMEALLPMLKPGGVYVCEDVHGIGNAFAREVYALADKLNSIEGVSVFWVNHGREFVVQTSSVQANIHSVHLYPYVIVIEKRETALAELRAPRHGSQWQPFIR